MAAVPFKVEDLSTVTAAAQIRKMGALYQAQHSTPARHVYQVKRTNTWIVLTKNANGTIRLTYSQGCAC